MDGQLENKTYNFYCDESTHLLNDGMPKMIISYVSSAYNQVKIHSNNIRSLKIKHYIKGEVKWSSISKSQYNFYSDLVDYFFASNLNFRAIIIDKSQINHDNFNQTHDDFYNKMYFQLLNKKIDHNNKYNVYIDIKDTHSYDKAKKLKLYLNRDYNSVRNLQVIKSYESELMQLTDVIMGAINYFLRNEKKVIAKNRIIEKIQHYTKLELKRTTSINNDKFNLFFIDLK